MVCVCKGFHFKVIRRRIVSICETSFCNNELTLLRTTLCPSQGVFCVTLCGNVATSQLWSV